MPRTLVITPAYSSRYVDADVTGFRMLLTASAGSSVANEVFRHRALPLQAGQTTPDAAFDGVCSPADLAEFPAGSPAPNSDPAWFRLATADLTFRSRAELVETHDAILAELQTLLNTLDILDTLAAEAPTTITGA